MQRGRGDVPKATTRLWQVTLTMSPQPSPSWPHQPGRLPGLPGTKPLPRPEDGTVQPSSRLSGQCVCHLDTFPWLPWGQRLPGASRLREETPGLKDNTCLKPLRAGQR